MAHNLRLRCKLLHLDFVSATLTVAELVCAEIAIIIAIQKEFFSLEIALLQSGKQVSKGPPRKLNLIFISGIFRVGGRIRNTCLTSILFSCHQVIIQTSCSRGTLWYVVYMDATSTKVLGGLPLSLFVVWQI